MNILFSSDWHLGLTRAAHTTQASSKALRSRMNEQVKKAMQEVTYDLHFCLGDMFDNYSNPESVLANSLYLVKETDIIMAGNHDLRNSADSIGSLQLLNQLHPETFLVNDWGDHSATSATIGNTTFVFVPHVPTQEAFEQALDDAISEAQKGSGFKVLCLHCNFAAESLELSDSTLNLSREKAHDLLAYFHHIFMGHEHVPREEFNGRLVILGNVHPTGFADMSDKRVIDYDTETGTWKSHLIWDMSSGHWEGKLSELPEDTDTAFLDLLDDLPQGEGFKRVSDLFGKGTALAIRLKAKETDKALVVAPTTVSMETLPAVVGDTLKKEKPDLNPLWEELLHAAQD